MPLVKQRNGLLEEQDFYLTSSFADFLISGEASRKDGVFELRKGEIKRHFIYETFVIEVKKNYQSLEASNRQICFIETNQRKLGLYDAKGAGYCAYWRILCHERFVQVYKSGDGQAWETIGGEHLEAGETILYQGFEVIGDQPLCFTSYQVYNDPFVTLQNFPEGFEAEYYDTEGSLFEAALFDAQMTARLFWGYNRSGKIRIKDAADGLVYETPLANYTMGEKYTYTEYLLEMRYDGDVIGYGPTQLDDKPVQRMLVCNLSLDETYSDIRLAVFQSDGDKVELSLDGSHYEAEISIETLAPAAERAFYVRITKAPHSEFEVREFEIILM